MTQHRWTSRIKFGLELATFLTALAALGSIWISTRSNQLAAYQQLVSISIEFDKLLADKENAEFRPYFKDGKPLDKNDKDYRRVALIAEMQLDAIDASVALTLNFTNETAQGTWRTTFKRSFRESPVMCELLRERYEQYHLATVRIAKQKGVCQIDGQWPELSPDVCASWRISDMLHCFRNRF